MKNLKIRTFINIELLVFPMILLFVYISSDYARDNYFDILNLLGLFLLTVGSIFAIRPLARQLINPRMKKDDSIKVRNLNSGMLALGNIIIGFSLQFNSILIHLIELSEQQIIVFTPIIFLIIYLLTNKTFTNLKFYG